MRSTFLPVRHAGSVTSADQWASFTPTAELFADLRNVLVLTRKRAFPCVLAVVSCDRGDGRSYVAAQLAASFSRSGKPALLVDSNLRRPELHRVFNCMEGPGLAEVLAGQLVAEVLDLPVLGLALLGAGHGRVDDTVGLLQSPHLKTALNSWRDRYAIVVVDTPAASEGPDAQLLAIHCQEVVLVARKNRTRTEDMKLLAHRLEREGCTILGVVFNER